MGAFYFRNYSEDIMTDGVDKAFMRTLAHFVLPHVYLIGAWDEVNQTVKSNRVIDVADELYTSGVCLPVVPDLLLMWHRRHPHPDEFWLEYELQIMKRCDAVLVVGDNESLASDELLEAHRIDLPVFYTQEDLHNWITVAEEVNE